MRFTVKAGKLPIKDFERIKAENFHPAILNMIDTCREVIEDSMDDLAGVGIRSITKSVPDRSGEHQRGVFTGSLSKEESWFFERAKDFSRVIKPNDIIAAYAGYVQSGTGPAAGHAKYTPPIAALEDWAHQKKIPVGAVWWSIKEHGTKANPYIDRALELLRETNFDALVAYNMKQRGLG